jgi:transcription-repair coupling factor (superfamily II helicase)
VEESRTRSQRSEIKFREEEEALQVSIPREVATYADAPEPMAPGRRPAPHAARIASACVPVSYVPEARQRIEVYRKLAEIMDVEAISRLKAEMRDRFGPLPAAVELLLQLADLKVLAAERGISLLECKEDKLMITRHGDFIMAGGKFPRLTKKEPRARLNEIKRLLQTLR